MFGIGFTEILVICVVALLVFGPERLPKIASQLGKAFGEFNQKANEFKREFEDAAKLKELPDNRSDKDVHNGE